MTSKQRLSASVDAELLEAGQTAVAAGAAASLSEWVNTALSRQAAHDRRLRAIDEYLAAFEAENGEITDDDIAEVSRRTRAAAVVVRGGRALGGPAESDGS